MSPLSASFGYDSGKLIAFNAPSCFCRHYTTTVLYCHSAILPSSGTLYNDIMFSEATSLFSDLTDIMLEKKDGSLIKSVRSHPFSAVVNCYHTQTQKSSLAEFASC